MKAKSRRGADSILQVYLRSNFIRCKIETVKHGQQVCPERKKTMRNIVLRLRSYQKSLEQTHKLFSCESELWRAHMDETMCTHRG